MQYWKAQPIAYTKIAVKHDKMLHHDKKLHDCVNGMEKLHICLVSEFFLTSATSIYFLLKQNTLTGCVKFPFKSN